MINNKTKSVKEMMVLQMLMKNGKKITILTKIVMKNLIQKNRKIKNKKRKAVMPLHEQTT